MTRLQRIGLSILLYGLACFVVAALETEGVTVPRVAGVILITIFGLAVFVFSDCKEDK